VLIKAAAV